VWLSPGAQLKYSKVFTGNTRQVSMSGESFFEVTKNPAKPFIINSGHIITKVWGTSFRVRDIKGAATADVTVVTGKVSVKSAADEKQNGAVNEVMLYPKQQVVFNHNNLKTNKQAPTRELMIWQKMNLSFDNAPLKQVATTLDKDFDVNISITNDTIKSYTLNADFNGLNLPEILEILHKTLNVSYDIAGGNISLRN
jgi:ferric-dicitrate binding protein FerR (iron transport regulator)